LKLLVGTVSVSVEPLRLPELLWTDYNNDKPP